MTNKNPNTFQQLAQKTCMQCRQGDPVLSSAEIQSFLSLLPHWKLEGDQYIHRSYRFANFVETMAFINTVAKVAEDNDHHPDVMFGYNYCSVKYSTHAIQGLSENDFICAAKIDALDADLISTKE